MVKFDKINDLLLAYSCRSYASLISFSSRTFVSVVKYFINLIYQRLSTGRGMTASKKVLNQAKVIVMGRQEDEQHLSNSSLLCEESCSSNLASVLWCQTQLHHLPCPVPKRTQNPKAAFLIKLLTYLIDWFLYKFCLHVCLCPACMPGASVA